MSQQPVSVQSCAAGAQAAGRRGRRHTCQVSTRTVKLQECMYSCNVLFKVGMCDMTVYIVWCISGSVIYFIVSVTFEFCLHSVPQH